MYHFEKMRGKNFSNNKKNKNINQEIFKENKNININNIKTLQKKSGKKSKALFINNDNRIESINIINNNINYKNIILQNLPTSNKQYNINRKESSRNKKNIKIERNILCDYNNIKNNFQTIVHKKQKSLNKNSTLKLMLNPLEQENYNLNLNDYEVRYKLKLYEKNNIINKLKDELEYYKGYYHSINQMNSKNMPNHNTINATDYFSTNNINKLTYGLEEKNKIISTENMRNKIKNIFNLRKNDTKGLGNENINNLKLNMEKESENYSKMNKESALTIQNKPENENRNKLIISNETLNLNKKSENGSNISNNVFYRSNSNTLKRKIKIGLHLSELNLDDYKYNSIEADRNHIIPFKNKKNFIHTLNKDIIMKGIYENENENTNFNYIEKFENLKNRMNNLVTNLFELLEKK